jgi:hypothetical protein
MQPPAKQVTPVMVKKSISVASIFKQQPETTIKKTFTTPHPVSKNSDPNVEDTSGEQGLRSKSRSSLRSPQKPATKVLKKRSTLHTLSIAFKGM